MNRVVHLSTFLAVCLFAAFAHAQGGVIGVSVSNSKLVVSNGLVDNAGFAGRIYAEDDADGFAEPVNVTGFGPAFQWTVPGVHISGLTVNSGLYIEALARPDNTANPLRDRVLWYWNPATTSLEDAPIDNHFLIYKTFAGQGIYLSSTDTAAPSALKIASPLPDEMNVDVYGNLVKFALHKEMPPPSGVYAVFARFKSDQYEASDPFLLAFNQGPLSAAELTTGALAINAAASDSAGPTNGDFNHDGVADAEDYTVWRNGLGTVYLPGDYNLWKRDFGQSFDPPGGGAVVNVPEPALPATLAVLAWLLGSISVRDRRHNVRVDRTSAPHFS